MRGAAVAVRNRWGYRCAAPHSRTDRAARRVQEHAEATRGATREARAVRGGGDAGVLSSLHAASARHPLPRTPSLPDRHTPTDVPTALAIRRRSPMRRGGRHPPTQHSRGNGHALAKWDWPTWERCKWDRPTLSRTVAPAGRSASSTSRARELLLLLLPAADQCAVVYIWLCRAQRGGTGARRMHARVTHDAAHYEFTW
jgi:hypothetical protein